MEDAVTTATKAQPHTHDIQGVVDALKTADQNDEQVALVLLGAETELKISPDPHALAVLAKSQVPRHREFSAIFSQPEAPKATLIRLAGEMPQGRFIYKLAAVQAREKAGDKTARAKLDHEGLPAGSGAIAFASLLALAVMAGLGCLVFYAIGLAAQAIRWEGHPLAPKSPGMADQLALRAAQFLGAFLLAGIFVEAAMKYWPTSAHDTTNMIRTMVSDGGESLAIILVTWAITLIPVEGRKFSLADYGITRAALGRSLTWAFAGLLAAVPLVIAGGLLGEALKGIAPKPTHPITQLLEDTSNIPMVLIAFFAAAIQAPIFEEIAFRGTLFPALMGLFRGSKYGVVLAIAASSLLFAALHPQGLSAWLALSMVGVVNCVLTLQTRSVLPAIFMHAMFNSVVLAANLVFR